MSTVDGEKIRESLETMDSLRKVYKTGFQILSYYCLKFQVLTLSSVANNTQNGNGLKQTTGAGQIPVSKESG